MKQAILITAYKNYNHLEEIINFFDENFELYIHIDKKSKISETELMNLNKYENVKLVSRKFNVNWGGLNHLKCILYLCEQALKNPDIYYLHLISGSDYPIQKVSSFLDFFKINSNEEYLNYFEIPRPNGADNGGMDRIEYFNLYDFFNAKIPYENRIIRRLIYFQRRIGYKRPISSKIPKLYSGSTWWSLSRECVQYVMRFTFENNFLLKRMKCTLCSEEIYFQTIILNSKFALKVNQNTLRCIDWVARNGNNPAVLDTSDFEKLLTTDAFFARKIEYPQSVLLMNKIKSFLEI